MPASRSARERKAQASAGPLAEVRIEVGPDDQFVYKIHCTECTSPRPGSGDRRWGTQRRGQDNGYMAAMDRWIFHLTERHPDSEAPCLAYLDEARRRVEERRTTSSD
ncbi:hypothetical protein [Nocardioides daphniae]|uniref:Uncharacterized protein n=1 Tax=Nocardioides daphniae TaxID=402297 RepID=A0A4P7UBP9_9ACTN|nr:hypothetical protein [Nocardioides daphniae]QCC77602.1 hypothetical protein E2C04_11230 [Nocardioides daphniae]GGD30315.1 hypothetical protein GCM10007231_32220 [Nocardioides daphniae]